jgi:two-component system chemotaxis response regulator CheB
MSEDPIPELDPRRYDVLAIGSSTGGPGVVETILSNLPADLPVPVLLAQHMPPTFTASFAHRLGLISPLTVVHAQDGMPLLPGTVYVGVGHQHMRVVRKGLRQQIEISPEPVRLVYKPSVDELFASCASVYRGRVIGVVLTGIGRDGTQGAQAIHAAGGIILSQLGSTCAVFGMPRSIEEAGLSAARLSPAAIAKALLQLSPMHAGAGGARQ